MSKAISYFKRPLLLSYRGILSLVIVTGAGVLCSGLARKEPHYAAVYLIVYIVAALTLVCYQATKLDYFGVSDKALVIRNSLFFWRRREILFPAIKSIRIDADYIRAPGLSLGWGTPYYLKVCFEDQEQERFYAGGLGGKQWSRLTAELVKYQVRVINTCPYVPFRDML